MEREEVARILYMNTSDEALSSYKSAERGPAIAEACSVAIDVLTVAAHSPKNLWRSWMGG